jgi:putative tryptophan/tyrosine transport system substrate-binding protein
MRRREVITLLAGVSIAPSLAAHAQEPAKLARVGFLGLAPASSWASRLEIFRSGLRELGWVEGRNILIEFRWAEGTDQLPELAAELVRMNVDVIFAVSSTYVEVARRATQTIPIVFAIHADPVGLGHVASLARPGGNITGLSMLLTELAAKELQILKEAVPQATRIGVLWNPTTPSHPRALTAVEWAGEKLAVQLYTASVRIADDFEGAFSAMTRERVGAFLSVSGPLDYAQRTPLAELALKHRLPGMFGQKENVKAGGLMSYSADTLDLVRRSAAYIDRILKGSSPADLPVEQASKYELAINLKTANALGLEIPPIVLARADELIE